MNVALILLSEKLIVCPHSNRIGRGIRIIGYVVFATIFIYLAWLQYRYWNHGI